MPSLRCSPPPIIKREYDEVLSFSKYDIDTNLATLQLCNGDLHDWGTPHVPCPCSIPKLPGENNTVDIGEDAKRLHDIDSRYRVHRRPQTKYPEPSYWAANDLNSDIGNPVSDDEEPGFPNKLEAIPGLYIPEHLDVSEDENDKLASPFDSHQRNNAILVTRVEKFIPFHESTSLLANITGRSVEEAFSTYRRKLFSISPQSEHAEYSPSASEISLPDSDFNESPPDSPSFDGVERIMDEEPNSAHVPHMQMSHEEPESQHLEVRKASLPTDSTLPCNILSREQPPIPLVLIDTASSSLIAYPLATSNSEIVAETAQPKPTFEVQSKGVKRKKTALKNNRETIMLSPRNVFLSSTPSDAEKQQGDRHIVDRRRPDRLRKSPTHLLPQLLDSDDEESDDSSNLKMTRRGKKTASKKVYKCELCPKTFTRRNDVKRHMSNASVHKAAIPSKLDSDTRCRRCGEELSRIDARNRHEAKNACFKRTIPRPDGYIRAITGPFVISRS